MVPANPALNRLPNINLLRCRALASSGATKAITFMSKLDAAEVGSSCHIHQSIWQNGKPLFWDGNKGRPSKFFRHFLGGLMKYSPELSYFYAPTINSYKRYQSASWAPTRVFNSQRGANSQVGKP